MQFVEKAAWFPEWGISYFLGIDGISLLLVLLTTFLTILCVLISWKSIETRVKEYYITFLFLETAMIGTLCALDLVLFYIFWELMLIPMYLLIGIWGGPRRIYAAIKFFLFTMVGSVLMLLAIFVLYFHNAAQTGIPSFNVFDLYKTTVPIGLQYWLFAAFALSFAIKVPMFPVHTWLPDAHTEAPTAGSVILAGVLLKMGTYGFLRFAIPLFPKAAFDAIPLMITLASIGIIYGAIVSMMQPDMKRLIAFSSVSHLGYVMLGMFAFNMQGMQGSIYQMLNHGISTGRPLPFSRHGIREAPYEDDLRFRRAVRLDAHLCGLFHDRHAFVHSFAGTNGFIGEFLILLGAFKSSQALRYPRRYRRDTGRRLHALDVPAGHVRRDKARREQEGEGPGCEGSAHPLLRCLLHHPHGRLPEDVLKEDGHVRAGLPGFCEGEERVLFDDGRSNSRPWRPSCPAQAADRGYGMNIMPSPSDFEWILPEITVAVFGLLVLLADAARTGRAAAGWAVCSPLSGLPSPSISRCTSGPCGRTFSAACTSSTGSAPSLRPYSS